MNELKIPTNLETISLIGKKNYRLIKMGKIKDYFDQEIKDQELLKNRLSKYITCFDYTEKILTVFLTVFSGTNIFSHVKGKKRLLGLITSVFSFLFCLSFGVVKKLQQETKIRKKKHNRLLYLAKNKLDCIEMLISKSALDGSIDHNEFSAIIKEKKQYDNENNEGDKNKLSEVEIVKKNMHC